MEKQSTRYCLYARKSTESDERQAMSIDSQIKEMQALAAREDLNVVTVKKESFSAKQSGSRPVFNQLLHDVRSGEFDEIEPSEVLFKRIEKHKRMTSRLIKYHGLKLTE